jgi:hypothetical protein
LDKSGHVLTGCAAFADAFVDVDAFVAAFNDAFNDAFADVDAFVAAFNDAFADVDADVANNSDFPRLVARSPDRDTPCFP